MNSPIPPDAEVRSSPKLPLKPSTRVACHDGMGLGPNLALTTQDLSQTEIRLVVKTPVHIGQEIEVDLESVLHPRPLKVLAKVLWVEPTSHGAYCIGAKFLQKLPYSDVQMLTRR